MGWDANGNWDGTGSGGGYDPSTGSGGYIDNSGNSTYTPLDYSINNSVGIGGLSDYTPGDWTSTSIGTDPFINLGNSAYNTDGSINIGAVTSTAEQSGWDLSGLASKALTYLTDPTNWKTIAATAGGIGAFLQANGASKQTPAQSAAEQYQAMHDVLHKPIKVNGQMVDMYGAIDGIKPIDRQRQDTSGKFIPPPATPVVAAANGGGIGYYANGGAVKAGNQNRPNLVIGNIIKDGGYFVYRDPITNIVMKTKDETLANKNAFVEQPLTELTPRQILTNEYEEKARNATTPAERTAIHQEYIQKVKELGADSGSTTHTGTIKNANNVDIWPVKNWVNADGTASVEYSDGQVRSTFEDGTAVTAAEYGKRYGHPLGNGQYSGGTMGVPKGMTQGAPGALQEIADKAYGKGVYTVNADGTLTKNSSTSGTTPTTTTTNTNTTTTAETGANANIPRSQNLYTGDFSKYGHQGQGGEHQWYNISQPLVDVKGGILDPTTTGANQPKDAWTGLTPTTVVAPTPSTTSLAQNIAAGTTYVPPATPAAVTAPTGYANWGAPAATTGAYVPPLVSPNAYNYQAAPPALAPAYAKGGFVFNHANDRIIPPMMAEGSDRPRMQGHIQGEGDGQSDNIAAQLSDGEYVFSADDVASLGSGSTNAGVKALDNMRMAIRAHQRKAPISKIPPAAKSPLEYLRDGKKFNKKKIN